MSRVGPQVLWRGPAQRHSALASEDQEAWTDKRFWLLLSEREAALAFNDAVRIADGPNGGFALSQINFIEDKNGVS